MTNYFTGPHIPKSHSLTYPACAGDGAVPWPWPAWLTWGLAYKQKHKIKRRNMYRRIFWKTWTPEKIAEIIRKFEQYGFTIGECVQKMQI